MQNGTRGLPHYQDDLIAGQHIFYSLLAALIAASEAGAADNGVTYDEIYSNPRPGRSVANVTTVSYWAPDTYASYLDWVNPFELVAFAGDVGRDIEREIEKKLLGIVVTKSGPNGPEISYALDSEGNLLSVSPWKDGVLQPSIPADDYYKMLAKEGKKGG